MNVQEPLVDLFSKAFDRPSDLLCCAFGLRNTEIDTYFSLLSGPKSVKELSSRIGRDRTTIQRVLQRLHSKGLVEQQELNFDRGGRYFIYSAVSTETVRKEILDRLEQWYNRTRRFLLENWPEQPD